MKTKLDKIIFYLHNLNCRLSYLNSGTGWAWALQVRVTSELWVLITISPLAPDSLGGSLDNGSKNVGKLNEKVNQVN